MEFNFDEFVDALFQNYTFKTMYDDETMLHYGKDGYYVNGERTLKTICANTDGLRNHHKV